MASVKFKRGSEMAGYDPLHLGKSIEKCVIDGDKRKYTQLGRPVRFYHGSTSASAVGCSLTCKFCWAGGNVFKPGKTGWFYSPEEVFIFLSHVGVFDGSFPEELYLVRKAS